MPLWSAKYLPFADVPEHLAAIATLRHWYDPAWDVPATYTAALTKTPYLAYHLVGALLAFPLGADLASRALLSAAGVALPYALRALLRAFGTDERVAILACPLFWSRPLVIGFLPYVASVPVTLYTLALVVRQRREPSRRRAIAIAALAVLVFYLHLSAYAALVLVAIGVSLVPVDGRPILRVLGTALASLAPSFLCAALWTIAADPRGGPMLLAADGVSHGPPRGSLGTLFAVWTHDIWRGHLDEAGGIAFWVLVLWLGVQRRAHEPDGARGVVLRFVPFACVLLLFVTLPYRLGTGSMINVRLAVLLSVFVLVALRPDPGSASRVPLALGAVLAAFTAVTAIVEIRRAQAEIGDFDAVLARVRPGARLLSLHFDRESHVVQGPAWIHVGAYHRLRRGGVASLSFAEMPHWPVQYRPDARPPPKGDLFFWDFEPCLFRNTVDGPYFDYILSTGPVDPLDNAPPGPAWERIAVIGRWRLDEKTAGSWRSPEAQDPGPVCP